MTCPGSVTRGLEMKGRLAGHRQREKVVSVLAIDGGPGFLRRRLAIGDEQKIGAADGVRQAPPGRQIAHIVGTAAGKGFAQQRNAGRVQGGQALFELQQIRAVVFAVAERQQAVLFVFRVMVDIETGGVVPDDLVGRR